ncbi:MAG: type 2 isopentenyl-diphosphate Delta-isomerase [Crenarchaeota archaeon]|nr:type 2 isopentenyl-diphosphate Delta-isomerase [Thermoproteota archaeon]
MKGISTRKDEHLEIALRGDVEGPLSTWLECARFVHNALPEISIEDVDTSVEFLGRSLRAPLLIEAITGGSLKAKEVNERLARIAQELGIAIEVGSQRPMLLDPSLAESYKVVRRIAKDVPVIANIGGVQLAKIGVEGARKLAEEIEADAISIHLNPVHEIVQVEGDRDFRGVLDSIRSAVRELGLPVIVKEVGFGISREVAKLLSECGVHAIDVAGAGGTNWVRIEMLRRYSEGSDSIYFELADWGIPTAASIIEARSGAPSTIIIASGGIRRGVDIAVSIALGADIVGIARPALLDAVCGTRNVESMIRTLRSVMVLLGASSIKELASAPLVIMDKLAQWVCARKLGLRNKNAYVPCYQ